MEATGNGLKTLSLSRETTAGTPRTPRETPPGPPGPRGNPSNDLPDLVRTGPDRTGPDNLRDGTEPPSLNRDGAMVYARVWPDQKRYLEGNPGLAGALLRAAIDAYRGVDSPYASVHRPGKCSQDEVALAITRKVDAAKAERDWQIKTLARSFATYRAHVTDATHESARSWVDGRRLAFSILRHESPDVLLTELGWEWE